MRVVAALVALEQWRFNSIEACESVLQWACQPVPPFNTGLGKSVGIHFNKFLTSQFGQIKLSTSYEIKKCTFWWIPKLRAIFENGGLIQNFSSKASSSDTLF